MGNGRYIQLDKQFSTQSELRDWLAVHTLLSDDNIQQLFLSGEVVFGSGKEQEWFRYMPPREREA